jgi:nicotinamidase-related amidase
MSKNNLVLGPIDRNAVHLCVDMQRIYAEDTAWHMPWLKGVLPQVCALAERRPENTAFTRFIPAQRPGEGRGLWRQFYIRWASMTLENTEESLFGLVPELAMFAPPATIIDKHVYGPWMETPLHKSLQSRGADTLIISGGESDVCVLATVLGAIDLGYRVIVASDAVCSSNDKTHDSVLDIYRNRYSLQVEIADTETILRHWD